MHNIKTIIDDGFNAKLVFGAEFDGMLEIPIIKRPNKIIIPNSLIPFSKRNKSLDYSETICFYENDLKFRNLITSTNELFPDIDKFSSFISPDCSLYRDMPLILQITNVYLNRQIGFFLQQKGKYVIPNIRWGDERSYTRIISNEVPFSFLGVEKHSIVSVGTYGCIQGKNNLFYFREGLKAMLKEIEPEVVIVYGPMPQTIFSDVLDMTNFIQFDDWITFRHRGTKNGNR